MDPSHYGLRNIQVVEVPTNDNIKLLSWYSKPQYNLPTLLYFHGNSYDIGERAYRIKRYIDKGWGVLIISWRGYSGNLGKPTEKGLYQDGESAIKWLENIQLTKKDNIVLYGESLGTAVAVEMATHYLFRSIILEAPFTSIYDLAKIKYWIYPLKLLILDNFNNLYKIDKIRSPILIISGKKDEIIPHKHSIELFSRAKQPKSCLFIDEAMHNNLYEFGIEKKIIEFV